MQKIFTELCITFHMLFETSKKLIYLKNSISKFFLTDGSSRNFFKLNTFNCVFEILYIHPLSFNLFSNHELCITFHMLFETSQKAHLFEKFYKSKFF